MLIIRRKEIELEATAYTFGDSTYLERTCV